MKPNNYGKLYWLPVVCLSFGLLWLVAGCSDSSSSDYVAFEEETKSDAGEHVTPCQGTSASDTSPEARPPVVALRPDPVGSTEVSTSNVASRDFSLPVVALRPDAVDNTTQPERDPLREIKLLVQEKTFRVEGPGNALRISFDDFDLLKVLNMEPVVVNATEHFPEWLRNLDGKQIRVRGFMYPPYQEHDLKIFVLARDNQICCFGRNPKLYDLVRVDMQPGKTTHYILGRPFDVVGTFHIEPRMSDNKLRALYRIDNAIVIEK